MTTRDIVNFLQNEKLVSYSNLTSDAGIAGISDDSRNVIKGFSFVAVVGNRFDGNDYIVDAISKGAVLIISEKDPPEDVIGDVNFIKVINVRKSLSVLSSYWYGNPASKLKIIGVTGTKGKTTVVHLIYHIMKNLGFRVGMISTVKALIAGKTYDTGLHVTNPEPLVLQKLLKDMVDTGTEYAVVEVTSHGLDQERVYGINFDIGVLTNISKEHLDYHKTFSQYRKAKLKLFKNSRSCVLNKDDDAYKFLSESIGKNIKIVTYSQVGVSDIVGKLKSIENDLMRYSVSVNNKSHSGSISLLGYYNLYNILASISAVSLLGVTVSDAIRSLENFVSPEGRLQKVKNNIGIDIYIDFAHTPDSLENLLKLLRVRSRGKLICVFGCAGERDKSKRYKMGNISGNHADITVITAEDPRSEDVNDICTQIRRGAVKAGAKNYFLEKSGGINGKRIDKTNGIHNKKHCFLTVPDRNEAIYYSIFEIARKGDTVVFCGKGHEKSMCYGDIEHPWSDYRAVKDALSIVYGKTAVILGAGKGKRLNSNLPKVIHKIAGKPMILYTINNLRKSGYSNIFTVVGYKSKLVEREIGQTVYYAYQKLPLGTGHAAWQGMKKIRVNGPVLVVNGDDSAFYYPETLSNIYESHIKNNAVVTFASIMLKDPAGMGRLVRDKKGDLTKIVEEKMATGLEKDIQEVNIGMYVFDRNWYLKNIKKVKKGSVGEYYITDMIEVAINGNGKVNVYRLKDDKQWCGVNTQEQLKIADEKMRRLIIKGVM